MRGRIKTAGAGFILLLLSIAAAKLMVHPLYPPFHTPMPVYLSAPENSKCAKIPTPPKKLEFLSVYKKGDKTRSIEDPAAMAAYKKAIQPISQFENRLTGYANDYIRSGGYAKQSSACALRFLESWARDDALLGFANEQGVAVRKWTLATFSSSYAQIALDPSLPLLSKLRVKNWLRDIAVLVVKDYSTNKKISRRNNHLYWAAWSVAMTGAAIDNTLLFQWGMRQGQKGLSGIEVDGTLAEELARGPRALHYHIFAATPLLMLDLLARANHYNFQKDHPGHLEALMRLNLEGLENPRYLETVTGTSQDVSKLYTPYSLAWLEIQDCNHPLLQKLRPLNQSRIGGDATLLYSRCSVK